MKKKQLILTSVLLITFIPLSQAQQRFEAGIKIMNELFLSQYGPGLGLVAVYKLTNHSGIESGLFYKINPRTINDSYTLAIYTHLKERTILFPLMYRFSTRIANLSAGGTTSYIINYRESSKIRSHYTGKFEFAAAISLSKSFKLPDNWIFEPEIRTSASIPEGGIATSLNFAIRKIL